MTMLLKRPNRSPRKYLVYTSAGDKASLHRWLGEPRQFDIWITYYGVKPGRYWDVADYYNARTGSKFQNLHDVYGRWNSLVTQYDAVMVMDDDVFIDSQAIDSLFLMRERFDYWLLQPAFSPWGKISHKITQARRHCTRRETNFVEMTCPLFRRDILDRFMAVYDPVLVGWGIDWWFLHVIGPDLRGRVAIIDAVPCKNPRDRAKGGREIDRLQSTSERQRTWDRLRAQLRVESDVRNQFEYIRFRRPFFSALLGVLWGGAEAAVVGLINSARRVWWHIQPNRRH